MNSWLKRTLIFIGIFIAGVLILKYFFIYFSPFIIAAIMASLIDPIVGKFEKYLNLHRGITVLIVLILLIGILLTLIIIGVSQIYLELNHLLHNLPDYSSLGNRFQWIINQNNRIRELINTLDLSPAIKDTLDNNLQMIYNAIRGTLVKIINSTLNLLGKLPSILTVLFLSFIATFFISRDKVKINQFILNLFPKKWKTKVIDVEKELVNSVIGFIKAELILISITGIISGVGLSLIGNQYALIIGITSAFLDLIPIIGPALIFIPWIIYNLIIGDISSSFNLLIVYTLMAAVRQGAEGKVMGSHLGFHPLIIMIALYVGFRTMGSIGFILGPAILVISKAIIRADIIPLNK